MNMNMKKMDRKGFTLIELLVVVSIIAVLSTIGITVFNSAQANARDAKRRGDIDSIAKVLEANFGKTKPNFYTNAAQANFNSKLFPQDPKNTNNNVYCFAQSTAISVTPPLTGSFTPITCAHTGATTVAVVNNGTTTQVGAAVDGTMTSWKVCAYLENAVNGVPWICKNSGQ